MRDKLLPALDWGMTQTVMAIFPLPQLPLSVRFRARFAPGDLIAFPRVTRWLDGDCGRPVCSCNGAGSVCLLHRLIRISLSRLAQESERFLCGQFSPLEYLPFGLGVRQVCRSGAGSVALARRRNAADLARAHRQVV
ncbi:hypothetical protein [Kamptonema formosum]|uniref:hypothetical protein n=1 Tax=Kamptonema formosum TaxID=331992 RepID=UPI000346BAF2|nr:hypothetical protein [Oscillatoria sp. PCC 10802]